MNRFTWLILVSVLAGCAFGTMPDTTGKDFWIERDKRMARW